MKLHTLTVFPRLPEKLKPLEELARNLRFSWNWDVVNLFIRLNPERWFASYQNPVAMLGALSAEDFEKALRDPSFLEDLDRAYHDLRAYSTGPTWFQRKHGKAEDACVAYFSCEYGIEECLPIYSGGLGLLSGDHLKSASSLGVPLVAVGLLYQQGYFRQTLNHDGWQQEHYPDNDWYNMPVSQVKTKTGDPLTVSVDLAGEPVAVQIWKVDVGRTPLYLLDTNAPQNPPQHRPITAQLYGGDRDMRIRQEIVLGIGGVRALAALGLAPTVYHMNEGHSAFLALERIRDLMSARRMTFDEARELVWATNVFTTHTPVPAGNEQFEFDLMRRYFSKFHEELGMAWPDFAALGQEAPHESPKFNLTVLALKMAAFCNGVAKLHGVVSRRMWRVLWPELAESEVPITSITNGVHFRSWVSHELWDLLSEHLGSDFAETWEDDAVWRKIQDIPDAALWKVRQIRSEKLKKFVRRRIGEQMRRRGADATELERADRLLDPNALTIGFARRFATYKRGDLIFRDADRLFRILSDSHRPVQIIFAGKAHPQDTVGKELIKTISHYARHDERFIGRVFFVEDYDINVARYLVQGVDVWLNNPRRPMEASGTSGMKAAVNGTLNLSFLDGWWDEAYTPEVGWAIGEASYESEAEQDRIEAEALYNLLERGIVPKFYDRDDSGLPCNWIAMMKNSIHKLGAYFNTHRMVAEYTERFYLPAHQAGNGLRANGERRARDLAAWRRRISAAWPEVRVRCEKPDLTGELGAGDRVTLTVRAFLASLTPEDVRVEICPGDLDGGGQMREMQTLEMRPAGGGADPAGAENREHLFTADLICAHSGRIGYACRILPRHPDLVHPYTPFHLTWELG